MMKSLVCGIDLGTTNSVIAFLKDGYPQAIPVEEGSAILPSVVSFDPGNGGHWVGQRARNRRAAFPEDTVASVKRLMGKETLATAGQRSLRPEEISSYILRHLAERATVYLGQPVEKV